MNKEFKMSRKSKWVYFYDILIKTLVFHFLGFLVLIYFKDIEDPYSRSIVLIAIVFAWLLFFALPVFVLYFNHKKYSELVTVQIEGDKMVYHKKDELTFIHFDDILDIELWLSPPSYDKRIDFLYFGKYHFTSIHTKKKKTINISCLVLDKTTDYFPKDLIRRKKKTFPLIKEN